MGDIYWDWYNNIPRYVKNIADKKIIVQQCLSLAAN